MGDAGRGRGRGVGLRRDRHPGARFFEPPSGLQFRPMPISHGLAESGLPAWACNRGQPRRPIQAAPSFPYSLPSADAIPTSPPRQLSCGVQRSARVPFQAPRRSALQLPRAFYGTALQRARVPSRRPDARPCSFPVHSMAQRSTKGRFSVFLVRGRRGPRAGGAVCPPPLRPSALLCRASIRGNNMQCFLDQTRRGCAPGARPRRGSR